MGAGSVSLRLQGGRRGIKVSWAQTQTRSELVMSEPLDC